MLALNQEAQATAKTGARKLEWLAVLEKELKRRIGWADEAVSPFARKRRARNAGRKIQRAA
jgi:hypothetical protein